MKKINEFLEIHPVVDVLLNLLLITLFAWIVVAFSQFVGLQFEGTQQAIAFMDLLVILMSFYINVIRAEGAEDEPFLERIYGFSIPVYYVSLMLFVLHSIVGLKQRKLYIAPWWSLPQEQWFPIVLFELTIIIASGLLYFILGHLLKDYHANISRQSLRKKLSKRNNMRKQKHRK